MRAHPRSLRPFALPAALAVLASCTQPAPEPADPREPRDLEGVEVLEPEWEAFDRLEPWRLPEEPILAIGEAEGDEAYLLHRVGDVHRLGDGRILLVNGGIQLRMYEPDGTHAWSLGERGDGPGEFRTITGVAFRRDTLFVFDQSRATISFVDTSGAYLGGLPPLPDVGWAVGMPPRLVAALPDGRLVLQPAGFPAPRLERVQVHWQTVAVVAMSRDGARGDTLVLGGMEWVTGNEHFMIPPFGRMVTSALGAGHLLSTHSGWYEVELRDPASGDIQRLIRPRRPMEPVSSREFAGALEEQFESAVSVQARDDVARARQALAPLRDAVPRYRTKPAWSGLHAGDDGVVWAIEFAERGDTLRRFTVFDLEGELLGRAEIPSSLTVRRVGRDYLIGVLRDEWEVERVVVYRVGFPASRPAPNR